MPSLSLTDRLIVEFDHALRTLAGTHRHRRPSPVAEIPEARLSKEQREEAAALMRVNHCGEVCAQALYQGQALFSSDPAVTASLRAAAEEEEDHLAWTEERIRELGGRPSLLNPAWYAGSLAIGMIAGALGSRLNLGFLEETERQVAEHLASHLNRLTPRDDRTRKLLAEMQAEEARHAATALRLGAAPVPRPIQLAMRATAKVMTTASYYV